MQDYLTGVTKRFQTYKALGESTFAQVSDEALFWQYNTESNSIAIIVQHMAGNMLSRWTDMLNSDGEKPGRNRDAEFERNISTRQELLEIWNAGWDSVFSTLNSLNDTDLEKTIYIRNEPHTVIDAINRQLAHYPYHVGQIVFIGKMIAGEKWESLSIAKGKSETFNAQMFKTISPIEKLLKNIKDQAQIYLLDAGEFYPFGACIDKVNNIKPFSGYLYDKNDRPSSSDLINILEANIERELTNGNYSTAAICIDVSMKENGENYDALEIRVFEKNKTYKEHIKYFIKPHHVAFTQ